MMGVTSCKPVAVNTPGGDAKEAEGKVNPDVELLCPCVTIGYAPAEKTGTQQRASNAV